MTVVAMTHNRVCKFNLEKSQERIADLQHVAATETQYTASMNWNLLQEVFLKSHLWPSAGALSP